MHTTPKILKCYDDGYNMRRKIEDEQAWLQGRYNLEAFQVVMSHFGAGLSKKTSHAEYLKYPFFMQMEQNEPKGESNEEIAVWEMKRRTKYLLDSGFEESPL